MNVRVRSARDMLDTHSVPVGDTVSPESVQLESFVALTVCRKAVPDKADIKPLQTDGTSMLA